MAQASYFLILRKIFFISMELHPRYPQLTLAVEHKHKEFVTHPYCQQAVMRDFMGGMNWKDSSFIYKWSNYYMVILLLPFHILIHDVFRVVIQLWLII